MAPEARQKFSTNEPYEADSYYCVLVGYTATCRKATPLSTSLTSMVYLPSREDINLHPQIQG